ncbi:pantoate--beta-alanine ligase [Pelosinus sp. sgz500959]|uniref:pantoate--beta-alanine ligase n=1 Tax=Pelosinus sp. sgz500959 TaxID=3242472 RepID=UPI00366D6A73
MKIIETVEEMRHFIKQAKKEGKSIALVPTMGSLHEGHLTLMRQAKQACDIVVVSIFVNPTQFGPNEDFAKYPRDLTGDSQAAASAGVEVIFHPQAKEMYPAGYASFIEIEGITEKLCGLSRPGHFRGVATVVNKLLNIVQPDKAFFGQKDAQQVLVLQRMVADFNMNVSLEVVPIVREADGLAMSSRNAFLSAEERQAGLILSRSLKVAEELVAQGEYHIEKIRSEVIAKIQTEKLAECDYVEIFNYPALQEISVLQDKALLALAVRIGKTRLIDNTILEVK